MLALTLLCLNALPALATTGKTMTAAGLAKAQNYSGATVTLFDVPVPVPGATDVLIRVRASSVNHLDELWHILSPSAVWDAAQAFWGLSGQFPKVLGMDVAGTVVAVGPKVKKLRIGDNVWAFNAAAAVYDGKSLGGLAGHTWATYVTMSENDAGIMPESINFTEAGVLPLVAQTSLHALTVAGAPWKNGSTVLILGGSGGTGHIAVQLAKAMGATTVLTTASGANGDFVRMLGADRLIDYHTEDWWNSSVVPDSSVDVVYDTVLQPETGDRAYKKLKHGGKYVTLCTTIPDCGAPMPSFWNKLQRPDISATALRCTAGSCASVEHLDYLSSLIGAGKLRGHVGATFPLREIQSAMASHVPGKVGLTIDGDDVIVV